MFLEIIRKKMTRKQRAGKTAGPSRGSQVGGSHAPPGFAPVPNSRHGGYRKRHGTSWVYWYPDSGVSSHGADDHESTKAEHDPKTTQMSHEKKKRDEDWGSEDAIRAAYEAAKSGKLDDAVATAMLGAVDLSNPKVLKRAAESLQEFNLEIVGGDKDAANAIAVLYAANIDKNEDFCKVAPPACAGNLGVPRHDMPQIIGDPLKDLLKPGKKGDYPDRWKYEEIVKAGGDVSDHEANMQDLFLKSLEAKGIKVDRSGKSMKVSELKATQKEIKAGKAAMFAAWILKDKFPGGPEGGCTLAKSPIVVTSDGYILDGHHRYAAVRLTGASKTIPTVQIDMPMADLLTSSLDFPGVYRADIQDKPINDEKSAKAVGAQWPKPNFAEYASAASQRVADYKKSLSPRELLQLFAKAAEAAEDDSTPEAPVSDSPKEFPKVPSDRELDAMYLAEHDRIKKEDGDNSAKSESEEGMDKALAPLRARLGLRKGSDCGCDKKKKGDKKCAKCAEKAKTYNP